MTVFLWIASLSAPNLGYKTQKEKPGNLLLCRSSSPIVSGQFVYFSTFQSLLLFAFVLSMINSCFLKLL